MLILVLLSSLQNVDMFKPFIAIDTIVIFFWCVLGGGVTWFLSSQLMTSLHLSKIFCLSSSLILPASFSSSTVDFMLKAYDSRPFLAATLSRWTSSSALYFSASWTMRSISSLLSRPRRTAESHKLCQKFDGHQSKLSSIKNHLCRWWW